MIIILAIWIIRANMVYSLMNTCACTMYVLDVWRLTCVVVFYFATNAGYCYPVQVIGKSTNFINAGNIHVVRVFNI